MLLEQAKKTIKDELESSDGVFWKKGNLSIFLVQAIERVLDELERLEFLEDENEGNYRILQDDFSCLEAENSALKKELERRAE